MVCCIANSAGPHFQAIPILRDFTVDNSPLKRQDYVDLAQIWRSWDKKSIDSNTVPVHFFRSLVGAYFGIFEMGQLDRNELRRSLKHKDAWRAQRLAVHSGKDLHHGSTTSYDLIIIECEVGISPTKFNPGIWAVGKLCSRIKSATIEYSSKSTIAILFLSFFPSCRDSFFSSVGFISSYLRSPEEPDSTFGGWNGIVPVKL